MEVGDENAKRPNFSILNNANGIKTNVSPVTKVGSSTKKLVVKNFKGIHVKYILDEEGLYL